MPEKRNIVLITSDSLRADHCSFMGYHRKTTPTIDKMARKGLYFENAIISGTGTPTSMFGVFTGEYAPNNFESIKSTFRHYDISDEISSVVLQGKSKITTYWRREIASRRTLAQILSEKGYDTAAFHANPTLSRFFGFNKGFRIYQDFLFANKHNVFINLLDKLRIAKVYRIFRDFIKGENAFMKWEKLYDYIITWVKNSEKPFFLWVLLMDTHFPYIPPRKYRKWSNTIDIYKLNWRMYKGRFTYPNLNKRERQKLINIYDDAIYYADAFVSKLWKDLQDYDPVFIIHGDHGDAFGEHGFYGHPPYLYEELIHVPLVIYNADINGKVTKPISLLQIPSIIRYIMNKDGRYDPLSIVYNNTADFVISKISPETFNGKVRIAVRSIEWKLIINQKNEDELYNLKDDPYEQENLVGRYPTIARKMKKIALMHMRKEVEKENIRKKMSALKEKIIYAGK